MNILAFHLSIFRKRIMPSFNFTHQRCARNALPAAKEFLIHVRAALYTAEADGPFFRITCGRFSCVQRKDRGGTMETNGEERRKARARGRGRGDTENRCVDRLRGESNVWTEGAQQCVRAPLTSWRSIWSSWPPVNVEIGSNVGGRQKIVYESRFLDRVRDRFSPSLGRCPLMPLVAVGRNCKRA